LQEVGTLAAINGVIRDGNVLQNIFTPGFTLKEGDTLLVLGDPSNLQKLEEEAHAT
jgi:K+/H+ antiporter YhaU regulatory subunit KhtT